MYTCRQNEKFLQELGSELSEWRDVGESWRRVIKWDLERRGLYVSIELNWHALWNRAIKDSLLVDVNGDDEDALRINQEIQVPWKQISSGRFLCSGKWHCLLWYLITSVSEETAAPFFRLENKVSKCLHIIKYQATLSWLTATRFVITLVKYRVFVED
jgi:hypothetical protein